MQWLSEFGTISSAMISVNRYILGAATGCLVLVGCSSPSVSPRAGLTPHSGAYTNSDRQVGMGGINYWKSGDRNRRAGAPRAPAPYALQPGTQAPAQPVARPRFGAQRPLAARSRPRLRRFAAMPRHMPHAPHVRQHEGSCVNSGIVQSTRFVRPVASVGGGQCYIARPFKMFAAAAGRVKFEPAATLRCQMVPSVERWVHEILRPAAREMLGSEIVQMRIAGSYGCRTRNHKVGGKLSEHGKANALDISKFTLADGRVVTVKQGWHNGSRRERKFLRYVHRGACEHFSTVLGPNADRFHHDHFHFDLASHGRRGTYRVCK